MVKLSLSLCLAMLTNTFLGTSLAKLQEKFEKGNLIKGLYKYGTLILALMLLYLCGYLNSNILVDLIPELKINIMDALIYITKAGIIYYSTQSLIKLAKILNVNIALKKDLPEEETKNSDEDIILLNEEDSIIISEDEVTIEDFDGESQEENNFEEVLEDE